MKPATAGRVLTHEDLQTYSYCSELWHFGGSRENDPPFVIVRTALEHMLADSLRREIEDPVSKIPKYVAKAVAANNYHQTHLEGQVETWVSRATLWLAEYFKLFTPQKFFVVSGPLPWRIQISKTAVEIRVSGVLRTEDNQTLHVLYFSPYNSTLDRLNDPAVLPLLETLKSENIVRRAAKRPQIQIHILGYKDALPYMAYTSIDTNEAKQKGARVKSIIQSMEAGLHFPQLPCRYSNCPFKTQCNARQT